MKTFSVSSRTIARCPIRSMSATHYLPGGGCKCPAAPESADLGTGRRHVNGLTFVSKPTRRHTARWIAGDGRVVIVKMKGPEPWVVFVAGAPNEGDAPAGLPARTLIEAITQNEHVIRKALK